MTKSLLSRYIQSLRIKQGYSIEYVANRAQLDVTEYLRYEQSPETARASLHPRVLKVLSTDPLDMFNFQIVAGLIPHKTSLKVFDIKRLCNDGHSRDYTSKATSVRKTDQVYLLDSYRKEESVLK